MSTQSHSSDVKLATETSHAPGHAHRPHVPRIKIPTWLIVAYLLVVAAGAVLILGRKHFSENALFEAMQDCDAKVHPTWYPNNAALKANGTSDWYSIIHIGQHREGIASLLSLCESDPPAGLRLFRRALDSGNKSARLAALYCANYLARAQNTPYPQPVKGVLEEQDIARIVKLLDANNESDLDVRKFALHALSDLVILTDAAAIAAVTGDANAETRYNKISESVLNAANKALSADVKDEVGDVEEKSTQDHRRELKISTRADKLNEKPVLLIRWSTPGLRLTWWNENAKGAAKWDMDLQRYVFP